MSSTTERLATVFDALADPTRLRLLSLMADGEVCVCFFVEVLGEGQSKVSRHLAYLRRVGIVSARREGKWMHYQISEQKDAAIRHMLEEALALVASSPEIARDRKRLVKVSCGTRIPEALRGAPRPEVARRAARGVG